MGSTSQTSTPAWDFEPDLYTDLPVRWHTTRRPGHEVEALVRGTDEPAVTTALPEACAQAVNRAKYPGKFGDAEI
ncbi:hypothetical protein AB0387_32795 [Streptomyces sp. NPDC089173]|uniref:hypothetical protein n=1 Tax=Streptomyces sp. NPDC089173 TaxID=3154965 RepID=UPI00344F9981